MLIHHRNDLRHGVLKEKPGADDFFSLVDSASGFKVVRERSIVGEGSFGKKRDRCLPLQNHIALPITFFVAAAFLVIMAVYAAPKECLIGVAIVLSGIPVYLIGVRYQHKQPKWMDKGMSEFVCFHFCANMWCSVLAISAICIESPSNLLC